MLAEAVGYSRTRLSEIENGDLPPFEKAVVIANVLGVSLDRLLYPLVLAATSGASPTFLQRLIRYTPQEQRLILDTFQTLLAEMKGVMASAP